MFKTFSITVGLLVAGAATALAQGYLPPRIDFDGDGKTDVTVWRPSTGYWFVIPSSDPQSPFAKQWGLPGDVPIAGDFDGDGISDLAVWRPSNGTWYVVPSWAPSTVIIQQWGLPGDVPINADFDGDGGTNLAVWQATNGTWYVIPSLTPSIPIIQQWGLPGDIPVSADFDGDDRTDFAVWRPSNGTWYIIPSTNPLSPYTQQWGLPGDEPIVGYFEGQRGADFAVFRPSEARWYIFRQAELPEHIRCSGACPAMSRFLTTLITTTKPTLRCGGPQTEPGTSFPAVIPAAPFTTHWGVQGDDTVPVSGAMGPIPVKNVGGRALRSRSARLLLIPVPQPNLDSRPFEEFCELLWVLAAVMVGIHNLRVEGFHGLRRFFDRHRVGKIHTYEGDIDVF